VRRRITLLTDFGTADGYVGALRGVIATRAPDARIDDISHDIPAGDVAAAAVALERYWRAYPEDTIHLVVVDPGVGSARRGLVARAGGRWFVAPDNGVLSPVLRAVEAEIVAIEETPGGGPEPAPTFHGRDLFAPVAAELARGAVLREFGADVKDPVLLDAAAPTRSADRIDGSVIHVDRFGNLVTNVPAEWVTGGGRVEVAGRDVGPVLRTYSDADEGALLALAGSDGRLEIALRNGSAVAALGGGRGLPVVVYLSSPATPDPPSTAADASAR
jgi:S-adenosyl-L-methionine hydrolase (adenosine-forming)